MVKLLKHSYTTKEQNYYFTNVEEHLELSEEICCNCGIFRKLFNCCTDEVQSFHWTKGQVTLHPFAVNSKKDDQIQFNKCLIVSDIKKHNVNAVKLFILKYVNFATDNHQFIQNIFYISEGCAKTRFRHRSCVDSEKTCISRKHPK